MNVHVSIYATILCFTLLLAWAVRSVRNREIVYLLASWTLYASWGLFFLSLLIGSSLVNYALGAWLRRRLSAPRLWVGVGFNLALLGTFKYLPDAGSLSFANGPFGGFLAHLALPVGISFWTFQALSYLFDIYREEELDPSPVEFCLYMAFWPTVLSGPICRLGTLLPQFRREFVPQRADISVGVDRIFIGALLIALGGLMGAGLHAGQGLDAAFAWATTKESGSDVWVLIIGYGFQLFFNFAGYSHLVIGAARLFGVRLDENFSRPFLSTSPSEFWRRWHMSLSFWIRDYVFFPLATLRREAWWPNLALVVSMVTFGLWHRGTAVFAIWGSYHGLLLVLHRQWQQLQRRFDVRLSPYVETPVSWFVTFAAISFGWIFFRASDLRQASMMIAAVFSPATYGYHLLPADLYGLVAVLAAGYFLTIALSSLRGEPSQGLIGWLPLECKGAVYGAIFYFAVLHSAEPQQFIYFQF